jgi:predicted lipid-binding transport protein (Tim44 family)
MTRPNWRAARRAEDDHVATEPDAKSEPAKTPAARPNPPLAPFLVGTMIGALFGAVAGTLLSEQTRGLLLGLIQLTGRRLTDAEREQVQFELLLQ